MGADFPAPASPIAASASPLLLRQPLPAGPVDDFNNNNNMLGQGWACGSGSSAQSGGMHMHLALARGTSGCLPIMPPQLGLSLLTGAGSGRPASMMLGGELLGGLPISPHVAEMSSAGTGL